MKHILVADHSPTSFLTQLEELNFVVSYKPDIDAESFAQIPDNYEAVVIKSALLLDSSFLKNHSKLSIIFRPGSGLDNVDIDFCKQNNIKVINSPEGNCDAVAEHVIGMLLNMSNNLHKSFNQTKNWQWIREANRGFELHNKNIGIIGVGQTGTAVINKLSGFQMNILPHDKYKPFISSINRNSLPLEVLKDEAEIVSLHLPLTKETHHYANDAFFNSFKKPIYFINASRGKVVSNKSLLNAIHSGKVLAASLDVLENERLETYSKEEKKTIMELWDTEKVYISPHIAGWSFEANEKIFQILLNKYKEQL